MIDRLRRATTRAFPGAWRGPMCAAVPAMLLFAAEAHTSQPLPRSGANLAAGEVPLASAAAATPPAIVPDAIVEATRTDLLKRIGPAAREVKPELTVRESVVWPDGGLGCPDPGAKYTMAQVPGWRLVWRAQGRDWEYHAGQRGAFVYCDLSTGTPRPGGHGVAPVAPATPAAPTRPGTPPDRRPAK